MAITAPTKFTIIVATLLGVILTGCKISAYSTDNLFYPFSNEGGINNFVRHKSIALFNELIERNNNAFAVVISKNEVAIWSFYKKNNCYLLKIAYIDERRVCPYITYVQNYQHWLRYPCDMDDSLEIPFMLDGPSSIFKNNQMTLYLMPWPWWLLENETKPPSNIECISNIFLRRDIEYMYKIIFNPDICPFCIVKEAFGRKCDANF